MEQYKKELQKMRELKTKMYETQENIEEIVIEKIKSIMEQEPTDIDGYTSRDNISTEIHMEFNDKVEILIIFNENHKVSDFEIRHLEGQKLEDIDTMLRKMSDI